MCGIYDAEGVHRVWEGGREVRRRGTSRGKRRRGGGGDGGGEGEGMEEGRGRWKRGG